MTTIPCSSGHECFVIGLALGISAVVLLTFGAHERTCDRCQGGVR